MKISVVINTYNRAEELAVTLDSLNYLRHNDFEVVVVNGPSTDRTEEVISRFRDRIILAQCAYANLSMSRNIGIAHSSGEVVAFLDDDAVPEPDWLDRLERGYADPSIGGVGGFIRNHTGTAFQSMVVVCDRFADSLGFPNQETANVAHFPGAARYFSLTGCNSSFRRSALAEIGGFDEEFAYFLDETDVCLRLVDAGYDLKLIGSAQVHHKYAPSHLRTAEKVPRELYLPARSKAYFCIRHAGRGELAAAHARLERYQSDIELDNQWLLAHGKIDKDTHARLNAELDRGICDGVRDAAAHPNGQPGLHAMSRPSGAEFRRFEPKLPADQRLRLCMISREYPQGNETDSSAVGGIGRWTSLTAKGLAARGHEVTVITSSDVNTVNFLEGVWVHGVAPKSSLRRKQPTLPNLPPVIRGRCYAIYDEVVRVFAWRGLNVVSFPIWDLEGLAILHGGIVPTAVSLHTTYALALPSKPEWLSNGSFIRNHVEPVIAAERQVLLSAAPLLANSSATVRDIEREYDIELDVARYSVVPHGVEGPSWPRPIRESSPEPELRILFVGRLERRKGIDLLLAAVPELLASYANVKVRIVGDDTIFEAGINPRQQFLKTYAGLEWLSRIEFCGRLPWLELAKAYEWCDIFVAPSRYESFGLIFAEAFSYGKPAIGIDAGGVSEVVTNGKNGLLIDGADSAALSAAVRKLVEASELRDQLGLAARRRYEESFSVDRMIGGLEHFYFQTIAEWRARREGVG